MADLAECRDLQATGIRDRIRADLTEQAEAEDDISVVVIRKTA